MRNKYFDYILLQEAPVIYYPIKTDSALLIQIVFAFFPWIYILLYKRRDSQI